MFAASDMTAFSLLACLLVGVVIGWWLGREDAQREYKRD